MPFEDFKLTAKALDFKRQGKQRVEAMQILQTLAGLNKGKGWLNHPAVKMWKGYELALAEYVYAICDEWTSKGYKDTCKAKVQDIIQTHFKDKPLVYPPWLGKKDFHNSHKSNLIRKKPEFYRPIFGNISNDLPYIWPI